VPEDPSTSFEDVPSVNIVVGSEYPLHIWFDFRLNIIFRSVDIFFHISKSIYTKLV
jgi:hypothetical protein